MVARPRPPTSFRNSTTSSTTSSEQHQAVVHERRDKCRYERSRLREELETYKHQAIAFGEKTRRQAEVHEEEKGRQQELVESLRKENSMLLGQLKATRLNYEPIDDVLCEQLTRNLFHLLTTWCFSHITDLPPYTRRSKVHSDICAMVTYRILSPFTIGLAPELQNFLESLDWHLSQQVRNVQEHHWRVLTANATSRLVDSSHTIDNLQTEIERRYCGTVEKAEIRTRALRKMLDKAVGLHKLLHQQREKCFVEYINPGTDFHPEMMELRAGNEQNQALNVQYCHQPLIYRRAQVEDVGLNTDTVVVVRAIVVCA